MLECGFGVLELVLNGNNITQRYIFVKIDTYASHAHTHSSESVVVIDICN